MKNKINTGELLPHFEELFSPVVMKNLKLRPEARKLSRKISNGENLCIFIGSSGAGRDTILEACAKFLENAKRVRRTTTRSSREDIKDQERMIFIEEEVFMRNFQTGELLFAGRYHVNQKLYGISQSELSKVQERDSFFLLEENFSGLPIKLMLPAAKLIVVLPPSAGVLKSRLFGRDKHNPESLKRISASVTEIKAVVANLPAMIEEGFVDMVIINKGNTGKIAKRIIKALENGDKLIDDYTRLAQSLMI